MTNYFNHPPQGPSLITTGGGYRGWGCTPRKITLMIDGHRGSDLARVGRGDRGYQSLRDDGWMVDLTPHHWRPDVTYEVRSCFCRMFRQSVALDELFSNIVIYDAFSGGV
ncbi:hypothetical protein CEXT_175581 [Caerostris extrusa]|uniref:Uncharacterized protein n=1 Tax=Caerostris extrusa TaxID=172846 RepID=A0AAV4TZC8_CAEEX|nr:hypothetical protein CEXT_175581 [Caerostris extrusa]